MGSKRRVFFTGMALAILGALICVLMVTREPSEPMYKGQPLSHWVPGFTNRITGVNTNMPSYFEADEAVRSLGTNALPALMRMLAAHDSALKLRLVALVQKQHVFKINFVPATTLNEGALNGIAVLGSKASNAVPAIAEVFDRGLPHSVQMEAAIALGSMGPAAEAGVPALVRVVTNSDQDLRNRAILALASIHADPEKAVPALTNALSDPSPIIRTHAANALLKYGTNAKAAVPALVQALNDSDAATRNFAYHALLVVEPEAAPKTWPR